MNGELVLLYKLRACSEAWREGCLGVGWADGKEVKNVPVKNRPICTKKFPFDSEGPEEAYEAF